MNGSVRSRPTKGAISGSRNGVLEDPDSLDLDFEAIPGLEVASAVASLQLASSGNRPAAPHFTRVDRLESGEELEHLRERPEGSLAFADPRVLVDERAVSIAQPFLVVHAHDDRLVPQLSELVAGHDTRPEGVRPILPRSGPHAGAARRRLEISGREIVEDGHTEEMSIGLRRVDVPHALTEDAADLGLGQHLERPVPYVALQPGTRIDELKRVRRDAGIHRGEVDDFFPVVPPAEDRAQAGRSSRSRESHEPHARLQAPRSPNRIRNSEEVTVSPWLRRRAIPSLRPRVGPVGFSRTS